MTGIDTNVLLRFVLGDDARQFAAARRAFATFTKQQPGYVSLVVMAEFVWALKSLYGFDRHQLGEAIDIMLGKDELVVQAPEAVYFASHMQQQTQAEFHDVLIGLLAQGEGCDTTLTFDRKASRLSTFTVLES